MPVYKVWNLQRTQRKCVVASDLTELVQKGKLKLQLKTEKVSVVLEKDGSSIDEDEILEAFPGATLILLEEGEDWLCETNLDTSTTSFSEPSVTSSPSQESYASSPLPKSQQDDTTAKPRPICKNFLLPTFSSLVQHHLQNGTPHAVWSQLVSETAHFFIDISTYHLDSSNDYQLLGKKMYAAYPSIEMDGKQPWSLFTSNISQRIRHMRWRSNKKSVPTAAASSSKQNASLPKRKCVAPISTLLPSDEFDTHIAEMQKEWQKPSVKRSETHLKGLLKETFTNRQEWIRSLPDASIHCIVDKFPCFQDATYLLYEFRLILGFEAFSNLKTSMATFQNAVEALMGEQGEGPDRMMKIITFIESSTAFERGKGKKTCPVVIVNEDIADADVDCALTTPAKSAPHIITFSSNGLMKGAYVVGDDVTIDCQSNNISVAVITLLAAYYAFDLDYPRIYSQLLGIFQSHFIQTIPYDGLKSKKYCIFSKGLKRKIKEVANATATEI